MTQINDVNVRIKITITEDGVALNISSATAKSIIINKPDGVSTTYAASFFTDGTDGVIYYDTILGDLDQSGFYRTQGLILMGGGTYYSSIGSFKAECNI